MSGSDPYVYEGTDVLRNRAGLRDPRALAEREQMLSARAMLQLRREPPLGQFDLAHYQTIHRRLFGEVYDWAGQTRSIDLWKPEVVLQGRSVTYAPPAAIEAQATSALNALQRLKPADLTQTHPAVAFGQEITALWRAHPFREGNTRTLFAFVEQFARHRGQSLDLEIVNRVPRETRDALVQATQGLVRPLAHMIQSARHAEIMRAHPVLGRLSAEAREVLDLMGQPPVRVAEPGVTVQGQVIATSYRHALIREARHIVAVPHDSFREPPQNNQRIAVEVLPPGQRAQAADRDLTREQAPRQQILGGALIPAGVLAAGAAVAAHIKPNIEIPHPGPELSAALKTMKPDE